MKEYNQITLCECEEQLSNVPAVLLCVHWVSASGIKLFKNLPTASPVQATIQKTLLSNVTSFK